MPSPWTFLCRWRALLKTTVIWLFPKTAAQRGVDSALTKNSGRKGVAGQPRRHPRKTAQPGEFWRSWLRSITTLLEAQWIPSSLTPINQIHLGMPGTGKTSEGMKKNLSAEVISELKSLFRGLLTNASVLSKRKKSSTVKQAAYFAGAGSQDSWELALCVATAQEGFSVFPLETLSHFHSFFFLSYFI